MKEEQQQSTDNYDYHNINSGHIAIIVFMTGLLVMAFTLAAVGWALVA